VKRSETPTSEHLYPKIGLRQFSDIDLLFRIEDAEKALELFTRVPLINIY
jgi:hypothetical protein